MTDPVKAYALKVVAGTVPAGKYHRLACVRHLKDLQRQGTKGFPFRFVSHDAELFVKFAQLLKHYKGEWAGQWIVLSEFQRFRLGCIFGWRHAETGLRRFTTAYNELPRKTGKSLEAAVVGLYCTFFEGEPGAEGYCLATKERQAADVVFHDMKQLVKSSGLRSRISVQVKNLHVDATSSKFEPLGSDSETLDGLNPHCIITDELHAFRNRGLLDVMESATGARRNPLHYQITTAGDDPVSVCGDQHDYCCKILEGTIEDFASERFFGCIAHADTAHTYRCQFPYSIQQLVSLCTCQVKNQLKSAKLNARGEPEFQTVIPNENTGVADDVRVVTRNTSKKTAQRIDNGNYLPRENGRSGIRNKLGQTSGDGSTPTAPDTRPHNENPIYSDNMQSASRTTTRSISSKRDDAESAANGSHFWASTTATIRQKFVAYCASPVIPDSVSSEILRTAYFEHSPTCAVMNHKLDGSALLIDVPEDDWTLESTWRKANPHYGISVNPDDIKALALKARAIPSAVAEFQQKRLNLWVNASAPCLSVDGWRKGQHPCTLAEFIEPLRHEVCYIGIDLASKIDLCALAFVFPPGVGRPQWKVLECLWTPEETLMERARKDRVPYDVWSEQGWLTVTEGSRVDHRVIRERIAQYRGVFDIHAIGFDPWHADQIIDELIHEDGFTKEQVLAVSQTYAGMTNAEIRFKEEVLAGNVDARGCPVTTWAVSNVIEQTDGKGNIFFSKGKSRGRIDPVKAATIGMTLALKAPPVQTLMMPMFVGAPGR